MHTNNESFTNIELYRHTNSESITNANELGIYTKKKNNETLQLKRIKKIKKLNVYTLFHFHIYKLLTI